MLRLPVEGVISALDRCLMVLLLLLLLGLGVGMVWIARNLLRSNLSNLLHPLLV
jgi:hypothetical protein